jgi:hypothetical protein
MTNELNDTERATLDRVIADRATWPADLSRNDKSYRVTKLVKQTLRSAGVVEAAALQASASRVLTAACAALAA